jgi:hypothetical protein
MGKACQFNLFHLIPIGGNQLWKAKDKAVGEADGLVDVSVDAYFTPAPLIGSLVCTEIRGTTYYLTGAPPPPLPVPVIREALPQSVTAPPPADDAAEQAGSPPEDDQAAEMENGDFEVGDSGDSTGDVTDSGDDVPAEEPTLDSVDVPADDGVDASPTNDGPGQEALVVPVVAVAVEVIAPDPDFHVCGDGGTDGALRGEIRAVVEETLRDAGSSSGWIDAEPHPGSGVECAAAADSQSVVFAQVRCPNASKDPYTCSWQVVVITPDGAESAQGDKETSARSIKRIRKALDELLP